MKISRGFRKVFASRLREARTRRGLDQSELAKRLGLKPSAICHFEAGRRVPAVETLLHLADELNTSVGFLVGRDAGPGVAGPDIERLLDIAGGLAERDLNTVISLAQNLSGRK